MKTIFTGFLMIAVLSACGRQVEQTEVRHVVQQTSYARSTYMCWKGEIQITRWSDNQVDEEFFCEGVPTESH